MEVSFARFVARILADGAADLTRANFFGVVCADLDLSTVGGLETIVHSGPSTVGLDTLTKSKGSIPIEFLQGCGLSEWEIAIARLYSPPLSEEAAEAVVYELRRSRIGSAIQLRALFVSYSHRDSTFVDAIEPRLKAHGIRFWRDTQT